jgi:hypothetical protein
MIPTVLARNFNIVKLLFLMALPLGLGIRPIVPQ